MCSRRAQVSVEFLIICFFALAIMLSLFSIYANMRTSLAGGAEERQARVLADRLAGAIIEVGQGFEGSEVEVSLTDADWLDFSVDGRRLLAEWEGAYGPRAVSSPIITEDVDFQSGERVLVRKENGKVVVRPV